MGTENITLKARQARLRWNGHILRMAQENNVKQPMKMEVGGTRTKGRPRMGWMDNIRHDMDKCGLEEGDTQDMSKMEYDTEGPQKIKERWVTQRANARGGGRTVLQNIASSTMFTASPSSCPDLFISRCFVAGTLGLLRTRKQLCTLG